MDRELPYAISSVVLFAIGLRGFILYASTLQKILALNVMSGGVFLFLVTVAYRNGAGVPDPVPLAMVLTGIVVAVSSSAFAIALARRIHSETDRAESSSMSREVS